MCRFVYITADQPLPTHEPSRWFRLVPCESGQAEHVRAVAPGRFIYCASSWQGCGCGFDYESSVDLAASLAEIPEGEPARTTAIECRESGRASVAELRDYLEDVVRITSPLRLYVVWAGEEGKKPEREAVVTPRHFGGDGFGLRDCELFTVIAPAAEPELADGG